MTANVLERTPEELQAWREQVLAAVGATREQLEEAESMLSLSEEESNVLSTVRGIDFLLGAS